VSGAALVLGAASGVWLAVAGGALVDGAGLMSDDAAGGAAGWSVVAG
jgi:hypothetical protein